MEKIEFVKVDLVEWGVLCVGVKDGSMILLVFNIILMYV